MTRPHGGRSGPHVRPWRDDEQLDDIKNANVIVVMGGNPAGGAPLRIQVGDEARRYNKARLIVVDPRFTRTAAVADQFVQIRPGSDIAFLGVINYLLSNDAIQHEYVKAYTNAPHREPGLRVRRRPVLGYDEAGRKYDKSTWTYELGPDGYAKVDPTLQDPRCVFQLMKKHFARYTPEVVSSVTGAEKEEFLQVCKTIATTAVPAGP